MRAVSFSRKHNGNACAIKQAQCNKNEMQGNCMFAKTSRFGGTDGSEEYKRRSFRIANVPYFKVKQY